MQILKISRYLNILPPYSHAHQKKKKKKSCQSTPHTTHPGTVLASLFSTRTGTGEPWFKKRMAELLVVGTKISCMVCECGEWVSRWVRVGVRDCVHVSSLLQCAHCDYQVARVWVHVCVSAFMVQYMPTWCREQGWVKRVASGGHVLTCMALDQALHSSSIPLDPGITAAKKISVMPHIFTFYAITFNTCEVCMPTAKMHAKHRAK